jgi:Domain of unknown function (DUF4249)
MKKIAFVLGFFAILMASSCSNELVLTDTPKDIPIIYGFLSRSDTAQYFRIEKAFISPDKSAVELAKDPTQLYFENITVELQDVEAKKTYALSRVDGKSEGYPRNAGALATTPNFLYKIKTSKVDLRENKTFKLVVKKTDGAVLTEADAVVLPDLVFEDLDPKEISVTTSFPIAWNQLDARTAKLYDVMMHLNVEERNVSDSKWVPVPNLTWVLAKGFVPNSTEIEFGINKVTFRQKDITAFYRFLSDNLDKTKPVVRKLRSVDIEVVSGGKDLYEYINVGSINAGITGTEVLPTYSNVKGGYGILSSRNRKFYKGLGINARSLDSLVRGKFTKDLKFQ